jgi:excinuclease ABC subunit C
VILPESTNLDVIGVAQSPQGLGLGLLFVRGGLLLDGRNFFWPGLSVEDTPELLRGFLAQYYLERRGLGESLPVRIVAPWLPEASGRDSAEGEDAASIRALEEVLAEIRGGAVHIARPRGRDEDQLVLMAAANAAEASKSAAGPRLAEVLAKRLHRAGPVHRIEVVDISHTGGRQTRAGVVVFEDERQVREACRVYNLDDDLVRAGAGAGDDYAALAAWAKRRAARAAEFPWPDLVLVDGGRGQLAAVRRAFVEAGAKPGLGPDADFVLASIAKARDDEGRADRRAGNVSDRIFLPDRSNALQLLPGSPELLFLQRIRDAAHDFVIGRHRRARAKASLSGELTRIPGIGPALARRLFEKFGSLAGMAEAGEEALAAVPGIGSARARAIAARLAMLVKSGA